MSMKLLLLTTLALSALAQRPDGSVMKNKDHKGNLPPRNVEVEVDVAVDAKHRPGGWVLAIFESGPRPCEAAAREAGCVGYPRDIAICLANSNVELSKECKTDIFRGALSHDDMEVLHLLSTKADLPQEVPHAVASPHREHHKHGLSPIVTRLRQSCSTEFSSGICDFAVGPRVCPRKLLHCLVANQKQLSQSCFKQTRTEVVKVVEADQENSAIRIGCSIVAWIVMFVTIFLLCSCCMKLVRWCCCSSRVAVVETTVEGVVSPSAPRDEDAELEMALVLSAAEAKAVAKGIPVLSAHEQV
eukprot:TRINITY_DN270_c0_g1_i8.p1 TRINITY_DN270_c0_g1~~TRINITY_DN270_c0_g1_i8.p1  ORF type:complete len:301 (+),score=76.08 TRINITY_DN270_c0_g1_i8:186-1088(+)